MDFNKKVKVFACGAAATVFSLGGLINETTQTTARETFIGPDGHPGLKMTPKENGWAAAATAGAVMSFGTAVSMFGAALRRQKAEKESALLAVAQKNALSR